jgi:polyhydroxyalkanoate synthesis regulator phasin
VEISLKNLLLAGIGTVSYSYEKGEEIVKDLIERGEITVNQGKQLNEELKRQKSGDKNHAKSDGITVEQLKEMLADLNLATKDDIQELEKRIKILEEK